MSLEFIEDAKPETARQKRIRIAKRQGIAVREFYELGSREQSDKLLFISDRLRLKSDIRNKDEKELTWYQKIQIKGIEEKIKDHRNYELRKSIFRTMRRAEDRQKEATW